MDYLDRGNGYRENGTRSPANPLEESSTTYEENLDVVDDWQTTDTGPAFEELSAQGANLDAPSDIPRASDMRGQIDALLQGTRAILFYPVFREITGNVNAAILLAQVWYWWKKKGRQPFYKFDEPNDHKLYKPGDSWTEELRLSIDQLRSARKTIAARVKKGMSKKTLLREHLVLYWRGQDGKTTHYEVNEPLLLKRLHEATSIYSVKYAHSIGNDGNHEPIDAPQNPERITTKKNQEKTTRENNNRSSAKRSSLGSMHSGMEASDVDDKDVVAVTEREPNSAVAAAEAHLAKDRKQERGSSYFNDEGRYPGGRFGASHESSAEARTLLSQVGICDPILSELSSMPIEYIRSWVLYYLQKNRQGKEFRPGMLITWLRSREQPEHPYDDLGKLTLEDWKTFILESRLANGFTDERGAHFEGFTGRLSPGAEAVRSEWIGLYTSGSCDCWMDGKNGCDGSAHHRLDIGHLPAYFRKEAEDTAVDHWIETTRNARLAQKRAEAETVCEQRVTEDTDQDEALDHNPSLQPQPFEIGFPLFTIDTW